VSFGASKVSSTLVESIARTESSRTGIGAAATVRPVNIQAADSGKASISNAAIPVLGAGGTESPLRVKLAMD
jgi:hypothetical protein